MKKKRNSPNMRVNTKGYIETYFGPDIGRLLVPSLRSLLPLRTVPISAYAKINFSLPW
jgi:hypothetical protein